MQLLGSNHREASLQVKTHLVTKYTNGAGTGAIVLLRAGFHHMAHQVEILFHFYKVVNVEGVVSSCKGCSCFKSSKVNTLSTTTTFKTFLTPIPNANKNNLFLVSYGCLKIDAV